MHFDAVLSEFIHPCSKKRRRAQYSRGVDTAVCARALQMCACASDVCACASDVCDSDVCACASDVCACASDVCLVRGKLLTQRSTPTIPSVLYARLVLSCSAYIES